MFQIFFFVIKHAGLKNPSSRRLRTLATEGVGGGETVQKRVQVESSLQDLKSLEF